MKFLGKNHSIIQNNKTPVISYKYCRCTIKTFLISTPAFQLLPIEHLSNNSKFYRANKYPILPLIPK